MPFLILSDERRFIFPPCIVESFTVDDHEQDL